MKKLLLVVFAVFAGFTATQAQEFKFKEETHNFGKIPEGPPVTYKFEFTNVGDEPLVIQNVNASCGCTVPQWPKEPIAKGEKGEITVTYNTANRPNAFTKTITINSNAKVPVTTLTIKGDVEPKKNETAAPAATTTMMK